VLDAMVSEDGESGRARRPCALGGSSRIGESLQVRHGPANALASKLGIHSCRLTTESRLIGSPARGTRAMIATLRSLPSSSKSAFCLKSASSRPGRRLRRNETEPMKARPLRLKRTQRNFVLYAPSALKRRAKSIPGCRWDRTERAWVYPRKRATFAQLLLEFGEDILRVLASDNRRLESRLSMLERRLDSVHLDERHAATDVSPSVADASAQDVVELRRRCAAASRFNERLSTELKAREAELARIRLLVSNKPHYTTQDVRCPRCSAPVTSRSNICL